MKYRKIPCLTLGLCLVATSGFAQLVVTNGDFSNFPGGGQNTNVADWFDAIPGNFWEGAWQTDQGNALYPANSGVVFSSIGSTTTANVGGSYLYQSIGTSSGESTLLVSFDWGAPGDLGTAGVSEGMNVGIYAYDNVGGFAAGDGVDVLGGAGVTLLAEVSYSRLSSGSPPDVDSIVDEAFDISGASVGDTLFLRFNNWDPAGTGNSWPGLDNVSVSTIPEPSTFAALFGGLALAVAVVRRRK